MLIITCLTTYVSPHHLSAANWGRIAQQKIPFSRLRKRFNILYLIAGIFLQNESIAMKLATERQLHTELAWMEVYNNDGVLPAMIVPFII